VLHGPSVRPRAASINGWLTLQALLYNGPGGHAGQAPGMESETNWNRKIRSVGAVSSPGPSRKPCIAIQSITTIAYELGDAVDSAGPSFMVSHDKCLG